MSNPTSHHPPESRLHGLWSRLHPVARDVQSAAEAIEYGKGLAPHLFAAYLWRATDIPTTDYGIHRDRYHIAVSGAHETPPETPFYYSLKYLCSAHSRWTRQLGATTMRDLIGLLALESDRQTAWNALCGAWNDNAGNVPSFHLPADLPVKTMDAPPPNIAKPEKRTTPVSPADVESEENIGAHMETFFAEQERQAA